MKLEKEIMKQISRRLAIYKLCGNVEWYSRLQSGKAKVGQYYINLNEPGTPDWLCLVRGRDSLIALFLEAKSDEGKLTKDQQDFRYKYIKKQQIYVETIREISELDRWMDKYSKDFVNGLPKEL